MDADPAKMAEGTCWDDHYKPFACWYAYGKKQFLVDIGLYASNIICLAIAIGLVFYKPPLGYLAGHGDGGGDRTARELANMSREAGGGGDDDHGHGHMALGHCPDKHGDASKWAKPVVEHGGGGGKRKKMSAYKLGISGGYVFRAKIIICVGLTGMIVSLATNITCPSRFCR